MEIFLDTAEIKQIERWLSYGVLDGVTTNPSIVLKEGVYDVERRAREIAKLIYPRPVSVEVFTNDHDEMLQQARTFAGWGENIVVKIPVINEFGDPSLGVIKALTQAGIKVNVTAVMSFGQAALSAKSGGTYISIFAGRVSDEGHDSAQLISKTVQWLKEWNYPSKIIVGSIREAINIQDAALAGAHVITVPPQFLDKLVDHQYTRATVHAFNQDGRSAVSKMQEMKARTGV